MLQLSLLNLKAEPRQPVFGRPASWLGFGENMPEKSCTLDGNVREVADICFLYLCELKGQGAHVRCPAIHFDEEGEFREVFAKMLLKALAAATRFTGRPQSLKGMGATTAWAGEYQEMLVNIRARAAA